MVNSAHFQNLKMCPIRLFCVATIIINYGFEILHDDRCQHYLSLELFAELFKTYKCQFRFFQRKEKRSAWSLDSVRGFRVYELRYTPTCRHPSVAVDDAKVGSLSL